MNNLNFNFKSVIELINTFNTEQKCIDYLEKIRWNGNVVSPYDPTSKVYKYNKNNRFKCVNSNKYFNVKTGTLFEGSNIKLQTWFLGIYLITSHKKGISSLQLSKDLNVTQKTSWFMLHRIRECFNIKTEQLSNEVEIDESFIGCRIQNGQGGKGKSVVLGMVERGGKIISKLVKDRKTKTLLPIIKENVKENSVVLTDELLSYNSLHNTYNHSSVNHSIKEYVRGVVHTNTIEGFWSFLKRGFKGIYHYISEKHLQKYLDEFVFRYNTKEDYKENERFNYFFGNMECRLRYKDLIFCKV